MEYFLGKFFIDITPTCSELLDINVGDTHVPPTSKPILFNDGVKLRLDQIIYMYL